MKRFIRPIQRRRQAAFTYLGLLFFVAIMGVLLAASGITWSTAEQRMRERELLYIGQEFQRAIASWYWRTPGSEKRYPPDLQSLLLDQRQLSLVRHLRRIYADPFSGKPEWGVVRAPDGGVMGVYSLSVRKPIKQDGFAPALNSFAKAASYADWKFVFTPDTTQPAAQAQAAKQR